MADLISSTIAWAYFVVVLISSWPNKFCTTRRLLARKARVAAVCRVPGTQAIPQHRADQRGQTADCSRRAKSKDRTRTRHQPGDALPISSIGDRYSTRDGRDLMPRVCPVPNEALATLRRRLATLPARHPERKLPMDSTAQLYAVSRATLYRLLRPDWREGRALSSL